jgi:flagellar FliJ protein
MKRFAFSLEKVLQYRKQLESDRQMAFAKAADVFRRREDELRALVARMEDYTNRLAAMGVGKISARQLALYRSYLTYLESKVHEAAGWLHDAVRDLEARRDDLIAASKDTKVLEKVKEHKRSDYDREAGREETGQLDEIGATRFIITGPNSKSEEGR